MKMNYDYCKLDENAMLRYAPSIIKDDAGYHANPPQELYAAAGWYKKTAVQPEPIEGKVWVENEPSAWVWSAGDMIVEVTYTADDIPAPEPMPRRWSRLSVIRGCKAAGLWADFKAMLESVDMFDELIGADYLAEDDPNFLATMDAARQRFGADAVEALINSLPVEA